MRVQRWSISLLFAAVVLGGCGSGETPSSVDSVAPVVLPPAEGSQQTQALLASFSTVQPLDLGEGEGRITLWQVQQAERWGLLAEWEGRPVWLIEPANGPGAPPEVEILPIGQVLVHTGNAVQLFRMGAQPEALFSVQGQRYALARVQSDGRILVEEADQMPLDRHPNFVVTHHWRWEEGRLWSIPDPGAPRFTPSPQTSELLGQYQVEEQWWLDLKPGGATPIWFIRKGILLGAVMELDGEPYLLREPMPEQPDLVGPEVGPGARVVDLDEDGQAELLLTGLIQPHTHGVWIYRWDGERYSSAAALAGSQGIELVEHKSALPGERFYLHAYAKLPPNTQIYRYQDGALVEVQR